MAATAAVPELADLVAVQLVRLGDEEEEEERKGKEEQKEVTLEFQAGACRLERPEALDILECQTANITCPIQLVWTRFVNSIIINMH